MQRCRRYGLGFLAFALIVISLGLSDKARAQIYIANSTTWSYPGGNPDSGVLAYSLDGTRLPLFQPFAGPLSICLAGDAVFALDFFGDVREFSTAGALLSTFRIGTLERSPSQIAVSGTELFAAFSDGTIGKYSTSGQELNATLLTGLGGGRGGYHLAVSGTDLFVSSGTIIGHYSTSGLAINQVITSSTMGVFDSLGPVAIFGQELFAIKGNSIAEFTFGGDVVNASLVTGLGLPSAITATDSRLYVANGDGTIREYSRDGALVNASLISGLDDPVGIAVAVPEPSWGAFYIFGLAVGGGWLKRRRRARPV